MEFLTAIGSGNVESPVPWLVALGIIIIIIIMFINCNWVVTPWHWLFYMYTKYEIGY